jgi:hypothetical protein
MKTLLSVLLLLADHVLLALPGVDIYFPGDAPTVEGNSSGGGFVVLGGFSARYQQVYDASVFGALGTEGGYIDAIGFRADGPLGYVYGSIISNLTVSFSTTTREVDSLSTSFADNVGPNDTVAFGPGRFAFVSGSSPNPGPNPFHPALNLLTLDRPFYYDPSAGNLLLDVRDYSGAYTLSPGLGREPAPFDGVQYSWDGTSSVMAYDVNSSSGVASTFGLATWFVAEPIPEPSTGALLLLGATCFAFVRTRAARRAKSGAARRLRPQR